MGCVHQLCSVLIDSLLSVSFQTSFPRLHGGSSNGVWLYDFKCSVFGREDSLEYLSVTSSAASGSLKSFSLNVRVYAIFNSASREVAFYALKWSSSYAFIHQTHQSYSLPEVLALVESALYSKLFIRISSSLSQERRKVGQNIQDFCHHCLTGHTLSKLSWVRARHWLQ
jgi:hypothetical protein